MYIYIFIKIKNYVNFNIIDYLIISLIDKNSLKRPEYKY